MNCIVVDDEPLAQQVIEQYTQTIPFLTLLGKCSSAFEAFDMLRNHKVDLIFLDIHMPNVSGIDFINSMDYKPYFIFTTGYSEHALEGFNLNAVDYLLKPISFERFLRGANKAYDLFSLRNSKGENKVELMDSQKADDFIMVKADYQTQRIALKDITHIEGLKDYVKIYMALGKPVVTLNSLKNMADKLPSEVFIRIHKSYIVSINKIDSIVRSRIVIGDKWIPIGENFRDAFYEAIRKHGFSV